VHRNFLAALTGVDQGKALVSTGVVNSVLRALRDDTEALQRLLGTPLAVHRIERVISRLERDPVADPELVAHFGAIVEASGNKRGPQKYFSARMEREFLSLIRQLYLRDGEEKPPPGPERNAREQEALAAYRMVHAWKGYPGQGLAAAEREEGLYVWAKEVLDICASEGRGAVGAIEVAKVLARAPAGDDRHWPSVAAGRLLESGAYPRLADGLHTAKHNLRGVVAKSIGEGGNQEREIAAVLRASADALRAEFARTATMLDGLARSYESEAEQED